MKVKVTKASVTPVGSVGGVMQWRLEGDVGVYINGVQVRMIPAGLVFDYASCPKLAKALFTDDAIFSDAALAHDDAYTSAWCSKWFADAMLAELLDEAGLKKTGLVWWVMLFLFGSKAWDEHRAQDGNP